MSTKDWCVQSHRFNQKHILTMDMQNNKSVGISISIKRVLYLTAATVHVT